MRKRRNIVPILAIVGVLSHGSVGKAQDFSVTKNVTSGIITLTNSTSNDKVTELVVEGFGSTAGTTLPGWSATAFLFTDPLNCLPQLNTSIEYGFCYILTDTTAGTGIGQTTATFTYDSTLDDPSVASNFVVGFTAPNGTFESCSGATGIGCNAPALPEPAPIGLLAGAGVVLIATQLRRQTRT